MIPPHHLRSHIHESDIRPRLRLVRLILVAILLLASTAHAFDLVPGDLYSSNYSSSTINHYKPTGGYIESLTLPASFGSETRGLAFGPDGRLYVVMVNGANFGVVALDSTGTVRATFSGSGYIAGNLSYGKIAFGQNGKFFVAGANNLVAFTTDAPTGSIIYTNNQVFDVKSTPSGTLLVLSAYQLQEITAAGSVIRTISPDTIYSFVDARGVEFDPANNDIYVTMLGYTGQIFQLMRLDANTGHMKKSVSFWYGDDMVLTSDQHLVVGSRTQAPALFDLNLNQTGLLNNGQQMFVTQMPAAAASVPTPVPGLSRSLGALLSILILIAGSIRLNSRNFRRFNQ